MNTNFYGYEHGTPLSDIGEEETPRSRKSRRTESPVASDPPSPTPAGLTSRAARRLSYQSVSSNGSDLGNWEDFDSSSIMNGRLAADVARVPDDEVEDIDGKQNSLVATTAGDEMVLLNERAEMILDHARQRLTHMEDNLSKARHSILSSPRSSPNMNELHQPAGGLYRSISLAGASQRKARPLHLVNRNNSMAHSRGGSDTTDDTNGLKRLSIIPEVRSASALEYGRRQESPQQLNISPSTRLVGHSPASMRSFNSPLRVLQEEDSSPSTTKTTPETAAPCGLGINHLAAASKEDLSLVTNSPPTALARSSSTTSTRSTKEIRDQMSSLQNKISDLKDKAQADSMRRKSMRSMRTPSPFNSVQTPEQWYTRVPEYKEAGGPINKNTNLGGSPSQARDSLDIQVTPVTPQAQTFLNVGSSAATKDSSYVSDARTDKNTPNLHKTGYLQPNPPDKSESVIEGSSYEDAAEDFEDDVVAASAEEQIYLNEVLEESLQDLERDVPGIPEHLLPADGAAGCHEDRLDAFDYENMFLHSALGNYTGARPRSESPSESEGSSVRTTRMDQSTPTADRDEVDPQLDEESRNEETFLKSASPSETATPRSSPKPWTKGSRSNSMDSVSTVATFATATEGDMAEDEMPSEILSWGSGIQFLQPPGSPERRTSMSGWPPSLSEGRAQQSQIRSRRGSQTHGTVVSNGIATPPGQSPRSSLATPRAENQAGAQNEPAADHPANTEILMESLIKLADPEFKVGARLGLIRFSDTDKDLVLDLLRAVGGVCNEILKSESRQEVRAVRVLRRQLDESRKLLEGRADE